MARYDIDTDHIARVNVALGHALRNMRSEQPRLKEAMSPTAAALYVQRGGVYWDRPDVDAWDEERDAMLYDGPLPVVAHPPCGPWSKLRHLCTRQNPTCGTRAVAQVQRWGGVLEHPEHSRLWEHCGLPLPEDATDGFGGRTFAVHQVDWGHPCRKPTWIYVVRGNQTAIAARLRRRRGTGVATHCVCTGPRQAQRLPVASKRAKEATPPAFAELLISIARGCGGAK